MSMCLVVVPLLVVPYCSRLFVRQKLNKKKIFIIIKKKNMYILWNKADILKRIEQNDLFAYIKLMITVIMMEAIRYEI